MSESRRDLQPKPLDIDAKEWTKVDPNVQALDYVEKELPSSHVLFKMRHTTPLLLFLTYFDESLLFNMWNTGLSHEIPDWTYKNATRTINSGIFDLKLLYRFYAIKIYIQGMHNVPTAAKLGSGRNLRDTVNDARAFFNSEFPSSESDALPGCDILEHLLAHFLICGTHVDHICANFRSIVRELGEYVIGDEKLFYFTGNSGNIRLVITKPAHIGLWFYELVAAIDNYKSYMLDVKIASVANVSCGHEYMVNIVKRWTDIIHSFSPLKTATNCF